MLVVNSRIRVPISEFHFSFARSSGPGGQNVNKVNSKAMLRWRVLETGSLPADVRDRFLTRYGKRVTSDGDLIVSSQRFRDQGRNVSDCLEKLREMLTAIAATPKRRRPTKPSRAAVARRIETKQKRSRQKRMRRSVGED
ncbi:MAG: aminoacyl-tRNA hydrolase [Planctomycetia bacterium]|nr:aminoacyl-tRNA hydrolase [Planctomycetia bacterium]